MCQWCVCVCPPLFGAYRCGLAKLCVYMCKFIALMKFFTWSICQLIVSSENEENFLRFLNEQVIIWQYIVAAVDYCCMMVWTASVDFTCNVLLSFKFQQLNSASIFSKQHSPGSDVSSISSQSLQPPLLTALRNLQQHQQEAAVNWDPMDVKPAISKANPAGWIFVLYFK